MSIFDVHSRAAERNLAIVRQLQVQSLQGISSPPFDWMIVVCFYAAVRFINARLVSTGEHPRTHAQRKRLITTNPSLRPIMVPYSQFESRSRRARYDANPEVFTVADVEQSLRELEAVRNTILR